ncbi:MAG: hypothetical protein JO269_09505 [Burkholderiaceae bacterium]|nr:hypothetical protein [Burkholderiaceae bacterium]
MTRRSTTKLTSKQLAVLNFVNQHVQAEGFPPSLVEICNFFKWTSQNSAACHLRLLREKGYITIAYGISRGIKILKMPEAA